MNWLPPPLLSIAEAILSCCSAVVQYTVCTSTKVLLPLLPPREIDSLTPANIVGSSFPTGAVSLRWRRGPLSMGNKRGWALDRGDMGKKDLRDSPTEMRGSDILFDPVFLKGPFCKVFFSSERVSFAIQDA